MIELENLVAGYRSFRLHPASLRFEAGRLTALIGPNGCGKSTLFKAVSGQLKPESGRICVGGGDIARLPPRALARRLSLLAQDNEVPPGVTVADLVGYGRAPHQNLLGIGNDDDRARVAEAIRRMGLEALAGRKLAALSGGQRQRAFIAMVLAQDTQAMLFDEPTSWLDIRHQVEVLRLMRSLAREGRSCVAVLHDIAQAARYADEIVVMDAGRVVAHGPPQQVLTAAVIEQVYGLAVEIHPDPVSGTPVPVPLEPV